MSTGLAGQSVVRLQLKEDVVRGLQRVGARMSQFGAQVSRVGAGLTGVGVALGAPLVAAVRQFAATGDQLDKMSKRTGIAASTLQNLSTVAAHGGASLKDVENAMRGMARVTDDARQGLSTATRTLDELGITLVDLESMSPEERFIAFSDAISSIQDPTTRAAKSMEVFGRSGTMLLPMLTNAEALRMELQKAERLRPPIDTELAARLTDSFFDLKTALGGVVEQVGQALAPALIRLFDTLTPIIADISKWVNQNPEFVQGIATAASTITGLGVALAGIGATIGVIGFAMTGFAATVSLLFSPFGLLVAGVAAAGFEMFRLSGATLDLKQGFSDAFGELTSGLQDAIRALRGGQLELAAKIAATSVRLAFREATAGIRQDLFLGIQESLLKFVTLGFLTDEYIAQIQQVQRDTFNAGTIDLQNQLKRLVAELDTLGDTSKAGDDDPLTADPRLRGLLDFSDAARQAIPAITAIPALRLDSLEAATKAIENQRAVAESQERARERRLQQQQLDAQRNIERNTRDGFGRVE